MKWLIAIMAVYMLTLSCLPCGDSSDCNDAAIAVSDPVPDHDEHEENCTPFCVCNCCAVPLIHTNHPVVIANINCFKTSNIYLDENFYSSNFHNIWQPPRI